MNLMDDLRQPSLNPPRREPLRREGRLFQPRARRAACWFSLGLTLLFASALLGCRSDLEEIRKIQSQRETRLQAEAHQDHLADMYRLLERLIELNSDKAAQQILYHLNQWYDIKAPQADSPESPNLLRTDSQAIPPEELAQRVSSSQFVRRDVDHLRDAYLFRQIVRWVDTPEHDDWVLSDWFDSLATNPQEDTGGQEEASLDDESLNQLETATRLFDWTVRNVALQPMRLEPPAGVSPPPLPAGMVFEGPGYRQTDYQTLFRGLGDRFQRAGVFTQLCRQAGLDSALLATRSTDAGELIPWAVGVLIDGEVYLFEPELGTFIPGPDQVGIATLTQARREESVMRRLSVPGFFDYPLDSGDVQQSVALLNVTAETISPRMRRLQESLTGDRRLDLYVDHVDLSRQLESVPGIAEVRWWDVPLLAEVYQTALEGAAARDPELGFWYVSRWAILDSEIDAAQTLAQGRWRHLQGRFDDREMEEESGARTLYLQQRAPEFEIADLRIDVELQKQYGIRRELGVSPELYDQQIQQIQDLMRMGKRTATYWLSLLQYDDGRYDTAENWIRKRVLDPAQSSRWESSARYNLARAAEQLGETERAIELYKTDGEPQEHGNRIRARLIARAADDGRQ